MVSAFSEAEYVLFLRTPSLSDLSLMTLSLEKSGLCRCLEMGKQSEVRPCRAKEGRGKTERKGEGKGRGRGGKKWGGGMGDDC